MSVMKPSAEILQIAKAKAAKLKDNEMIRIAGAEFDCSYWVFMFSGSHFIGSVSKEPLPKFFAKKPVYVMSNKNGVQEALLQKLFL